MVPGFGAVNTLNLCRQPKYREAGGPIIAIIQTQTDEPESLPQGKQVTTGKAAG
jgi:hypothetical protein